MARIFISYAREDRAVAEALAERLAAHGHDVWWDHELLAGSVFSQEIRAQILAADRVLVLWSRHSTASHWVIDEASLAKEHDKLTPVRIDKADIPIGFGSLHTIDARPDAQSLDEIAARLTAGTLNRIAATRPRRRPWLAGGLAAGLGLAIAAVAIAVIGLSGSASGEDRAAFIERATRVAETLPELAATGEDACPGGAPLGEPNRRYDLGAWYFACEAASDGSIRNLHFWPRRGTKNVKVTPSSNGFWGLETRDGAFTVYTSSSALQPDPTAGLFRERPVPERFIAQGETPAAPVGVRFLDMGDPDDSDPHADVYLLEDLIVVQISAANRLVLDRRSTRILFSDRFDLVVF